jgi:phosphatidylglycerol---prolipoprotein diacylglyceryl transferase
MSLDFINWNIDPEIINLYGLSIRYYGILFAGGILSCLSVLKWIFKKESIALTKLDTLTIYGVLGIFIGARLGHCLLYDFEYYWNHPLEMLFPIQKNASGVYEFVGYLGLASHGGIAGLIVALILYARITKESIINTIDLIAIVAPLGGVFIRLANVMNSEIIGLPTQVPWAFIFERVDNLPRHPAQLYEALAYLLIFGVNIYLYKKSRPKLHAGFFFGFSLALTFIARFAIEFFKERQVAFEDQLPLDMGQLLSIPFIVMGLGFVWYSLAQKSKANQLEVTAKTDEPLI